jgi:hypothetical protein
LLVTGMQGKVLREDVPGKSPNLPNIVSYVTSAFEAIGIIEYKLVVPIIRWFCGKFGETEWVSVQHMSHLNFDLDQMCHYVVASVARKNRNIEIHTI